MSATFVNRTIDDQYGDEVTGQMVQYTPSVYWTQGNMCDGCAAKPDNASAINGTWHDGSRDPKRVPEPLSFSFKFNGTAVYVFNILIRDAYTGVNISLDGQHAGVFTMNGPMDEQYTYNAPIFGRDGIPYGEHTLEVMADGPDFSVVLFDYAMYTTNTTGISDAPSGTSGPTQSSHIGAIAGGVVGGAAFVFFLLLFIYHRYRKMHLDPKCSTIVPFPGRKRPRIPIIPPESPNEDFEKVMDGQRLDSQNRLPKGYFPPALDSLSTSATLTQPGSSTYPPSSSDLDGSRRPLVEDASLVETVQTLRAQVQAMRASHDLTSSVPPQSDSLHHNSLLKRPLLPAQDTSALAVDILTLRAELEQLRTEHAQPPPQAVNEVGLAHEVAVLRAEMEEMRMQQQLERGTLPSYSPPPPRQGVRSPGSWELV